MNYELYNKRDRRQKILSFSWVGTDSSVCLGLGPVSMKAVTDLSCIVRDRINVTICKKIKTLLCSPFKEQSFTII